VFGDGAGGFGGKREAELAALMRKRGGAGGFEEKGGSAQDRES
jgi:hypothetical protein